MVGQLAHLLLKLCMLLGNCGTNGNVRLASNFILEVTVKAFLDIRLLGGNGIKGSTNAQRLLHYGGR